MDWEGRLEANFGDLITLLVLVSLNNFTMGKTIDLSDLVIDHFQCKARPYSQKYHLTFLGHPFTSIQMMSNK